MDLQYSQEYEDFREEVKAFLAESWPLQGDEAKLSLGEQSSLFRDRAVARGYLARSIPKQYGGSEQDADVLKATIIGEEFARVRAPGELRGIGPSMLVPTLLEHGTEWQKEKFVAPTIKGDIVWCQGYSEPGSGSDLASLKTRAELKDDEWVINGQKIWTTGAQRSQWMFCLCRTEPGAQKHAGISYILIPMDQEGVEVRPLRQMTGGSDFNEVFLTDARTPADHIVGKRGEGWIVSRSTLKHERNMIGDARQTKFVFQGLLRMAKQTGRLAEPEMRQRLAELEGFILAHEYSGYRQLTCAARGENPGPVSLMNKLVSTNIHEKVAALALDLVGDAALVSPGEQGVYRGLREASGWVTHYMYSLGVAIAGGTANIQRNVIAERGYGLPRDAAAQSSK
ncbi:MAG: acyl-CoA dehydrogenase family protein [Deltaproteobacteria bacterium]|nr:acyl-CoA dehydrogenase family protein [Deltaproteobacteria bacterium]